jgi:outer membrane protein TolC
MVRAEVLAHAAAQRGAAGVLPDLDESLARARRSLEEVRPLYREGRQSVMEVLRAEEAAARARQAQLDAQALARKEWTAARLAQGRLDGDAIAALSRGLEGTR